MSQSRTRGSRWSLDLELIAVIGLGNYEDIETKSGTRRLDHVVETRSRIHQVFHLWFGEMSEVHGPSLWCGGYGGGFGWWWKVEGWRFKKLKTEKDEGWNFILVICFFKNKIKIMTTFTPLFGSWLHPWLFTFYCTSVVRQWCKVDVVGIGWRRGLLGRGICVCSGPLGGVGNKSPLHVGWES